MSKENLINQINKINQIDYEKEALRLLHKQYTINDMFFKSKYRNDESNTYKCIFGILQIINNGKIKFTKENKISVYEKNGIEILGLKYTENDIKYKYQGISIKELKNICKINNIKGYTKMDKLSLIKALLKC